MNPRSLCTALLAWLALAGTAQAIDVENDPELRELRAAAGRDQARVRPRIAELRRGAIARGELDRRLALDEVDCRLLQDIDTPQALKVAKEGAAALAAVPNPGPAALLAGWRLAACQAEAELELSRVPEGEALLARILAAAGTDPRLAPARALALLERGVARSRAGALVAAQADLLEACSVFEAEHLSSDAELCHWHLADHYKRAGDYLEASHLIESLLQGARQRGALADIGVYAYGLGQVLFSAGKPEESLQPLGESLSAAQQLGDRLGQAYAEAELARSLLALGKGAEALPHAQRALAVLPEGSDDAESLDASVILARVLNDQHRPADALAVLDRVRRILDALRRESTRGEWLGERAVALAQLGRWTEAYESVQERVRIMQQINREQLSEQSARLRAEYNRGRDLASVDALNKLNAQSARLVRVQAVAITLATLMLAASLVFALRKMGQSRALHRLAMVDELTGLPNRRAIRQRLHDQLALSRRLDRPLAVLLIDIDHFKAINDSRGHGVGDEVLRHLGALLTSGLRRDDWVGRLGGEEFLAVMPNADAGQASEVAERICRIVRSTPCVSSAGELTITVSVGVAVTGPGILHMDALITQADAMLYQAKEGGRDRVVTADGAVRTAGRAPETRPGPPA